MVLNYAVVGYGPRCKSIIRAIGNKMKFVGGFDPSEKSKAALKKKNLISVDNYEDLVNIKDLDAIVIGSPPQFHANQAIIALEHNMHVFSEVPMAINKEEMLKVMAADDEHPKAKYFMGENAAYHAEVLYAANLVSSGKIGPVVYCETEYLHDVSYRWRGKGVSDYKNTPANKHWYSLFDPLMYAHSILPAQVAMGGVKTPMPFVEAKSYGNTIGGDEGKPVCDPALSFHVGLFKGETGAVAKCASCYVFAREPSRYICQVTGRYGTYENYSKGKAGRLFMADGFNISKFGRRAGSTKKVGKRELMKSISGFSQTENIRLVNEWLDAINKDKDPNFNSKVSANVTMSGIAASEAARTGKTVDIPVYNKKA